MKEKRSYNIDLAKTIAYMGVVFLHVFGNVTSNGYTGPILGQIIYNLGTVAVPLFFVVNGYLLLGRHKINYKYSMKKIINIILVVFSWNVLYAGLIYAVKKQYINPIITTGNSLLQKGFFFQFWFLGSLILCYLFLPILSYIWNNYFNIFIGLFLVFFLMAVILDFRNTLFGGYPIQMKTVQTFRVWTWLMYYMLGGIIQKLNLLDKLPKANLISIIVLAIITLTYEYYIKYRHNLGLAEYNYDNLLVITMVGLLFIGILNLRIPTKFNNIIYFLSQNGFGVFILHPVFIRGLGRLLNLSILWQNLVTLCLTLIGSYMLSYILSRIVFVRKLVFR